METKIKNLLARLAFFADEGMAEPPIVAIAKDADALLKEMCRGLAEQQAEPKLYPIERVLMDADHMAKVATELLDGCASLAIASNAVNDEETAENLAALEQAEGILGEQANAMRLAMHEYRKRAQRFRDSLAESTAAEPAQQATAQDCTFTNCGPAYVVGAGEVTAQQADPVAWHTNDPCVSGEHIEAIAKVCKIIPSHTTVEYVARIVGFGHVLLADKSVQEAFVRANSHLLRTDAAQPPAVAVPVPVPDGYALVPIEPTQAMVDAGFGRDDENCKFWLHPAQAYRAMLATAPQGAVAATLPPYNVYSDDDGDSWREHPADADFVEGLQLGDEFELLAGWRPVRVTFRVTKVPDDESDDYEVEEVTAPAAARKGGAAC